ncbi:MAG: leucyl aminopeptidase family protein [Sandaracinus sp.]|nr:leucyl aminopeptidase family protein [Sandaracinus sp.]MCB9619631.1 leucyl aminopeptidase family protein [Sandaracinus sp.]MCB9634988.1 leucyl aminopeptidase family protein [Sandaracinus sp.]
MPKRDGGLAGVLFVQPESASPFEWARLPGELPKGRYHLAGTFDAEHAEAAALGWALALYRFDRYKRKPIAPSKKLAWPEGADQGRVKRLVEATYLVRDLVNLPANDLGPGELETAAVSVAGAHGAAVRVVRGDELLSENYPAIHAVGRASSRAPRLIDLTWGDPKHPKVTLVGKGVCFDSGGLDLKPASNMLLMKKDMGGAAHVIALAHAVMDAKLPVRLRVLVAAVENSVSGDAFRPMDVLSSRKGLTIEVGNTDAEGRLILCDALADACDDHPDLLVDFATLTGAARVALGTELPALFCNDDTLAQQILDAGTEARDPLWRLPLWRDYDRFLDSKTADVSNTGSSGFGGAITAALFLQRFVSGGTPWAHIDLMAWNNDSRAGRPKGGEAMALRAFYRLLETRYGG